MILPILPIPNDTAVFALTGKASARLVLCPPNILKMVTAHGVCLRRRLFQLAVAGRFTFEQPGKVEAGDV